MYTFNKLFIICILLVLHLSAQVYKESGIINLTAVEKQWLLENPIIRVGMDSDYAPYEWVDENGNHVGMVVDYIHRLEEILDLKFEIIKDRPWSELQEMAKNGELDMLTSIVKTPERSKYLLFSKPYIETPTIIISNTNKLFIGTLKKLSNKQVSIEKGYFMEEFIRNNYPKITLVTAKNTTEALKMVINDKTDAYVGEANIAVYKINKNRFDSLHFSGQTEYIGSQGFGVTKENAPLALILTKAIEMIPEAEFETLFNNWMNIKQGIKTETIIKYTSVILLIFFMISYWVYRLKSEIYIRKEIEKKLKESKTLYHQLIENMSDIIWKTDKDFNFIYISPSVEIAIGYKPKELIGHHVFEIFTDEGIALTVAQMQKRAQDREKGLNPDYATLEIEHKCKNGELIWGEIVSKPEIDEHYNIIGFHGISRIITERKKMQKEIEELAFYDPLTKLANRRLLHDRLAQTVSSGKRNKRYSALIYLDLDNFKPLNDTYGHPAGDALLIEVANRLKACVREMDTVSRVGGDEFAVIINELREEREISLREVNVIAKKILSTLSITYSLSLKSDKDLVVEHHCTASIGVLIFIGDSEKEENLFKYADEAMYKAKENGRNKICFYN